MCNGILINGERCPYEQKSGPNNGDCAKPYNVICPDSLPVCDRCGFVAELEYGLCEDCQKELNQ